MADEKPERRKGWKVIEKKTIVDPQGLTIDRYVRVRTMGVLKKLAFSFADELAKMADGDEESMKGPAPTEEAVLKFIKKNPRPTDKVFHEWAERHGYNVHKAEAAAYGIISDILHKGKSKGKHPAGIPEATVRKGVEVEAEHTPNPIIRRKINDDHNTELGKRYYPTLDKMEKSLSKKAAVDTISMDTPLFIRMLEWAHEDAKTDMQLHQATRNLLDMASKGPLKMTSYNAAVSGPEMPPIPKPMAKKAGEGDWIDPKVQGEARSLLLKGSKAKTVAEMEEIANEMKRKGHFGTDPKIWAKIQAAMEHSRNLEKGATAQIHKPKGGFEPKMEDPFEKFRRLHGTKAVPQVKGKGATKDTKLEKTSEEKMVRCPITGKMVPAKGRGLGRFRAQEMGLPRMKAGPGKGKGRALLEKLKKEKK